MRGTQGWGWAVGIVDSSPATSMEHATTRLAGACYLAMRNRIECLLDDPPLPEALAASGLAGAYANLCRRHGITIARESVIQGMQLSASNQARWKALLGLLDTLRAQGIEPVVFKGGAIHARWPEMRAIRELFDYDLIVPQEQIEALKASLSLQGFEVPSSGSRLTQRLSKGSMAWKGNGLSYQNFDLHARVTEPPVCSSLTRSILGSQVRADGIRVPDIEDSVCMIALHIVRSGMHRPLREYIDLLWYVDDMDEREWRSVRQRAQRHHLTPALFLSLRQAVFCLALEELAPERASALSARIETLSREIGYVRKRAIDWLAPPDYPLHPIEARDRPTFRRSLILGAGTSSLPRVAAAFLMYGASRLGGRLMGPRPAKPV